MRKGRLIPPNFNFVIKSREEGVWGRGREGGEERRSGKGGMAKTCLRFKQVSQFLEPPRSKGHSSPMVPMSLY